MGQTPTTIALQIGELDKNTNSYPLRLSSVVKKTSKELAVESIAKDELDRTKLPFTDPITTILDESEESDDFHIIGQYLYDLLHQNQIKNGVGQFESKLGAAADGTRNHPQ